MNFGVIFLKTLQKAELQILTSSFLYSIIFAIFFFHQMIYTTYKQHRKLTKILHEIQYIKLHNTTSKLYVLFQNGIRLLKKQKKLYKKRF